MRRLWMTLACASVLQVIAPAPAHAWWEVIEGLSGPRLHGPHIDARLFCFMESRNEEDKQRLDRYQPKDPPETDQDEAQQQLLKKTRSVGVTFPCLKKNNDNPSYRRVFSIDAGFRYHWDKSYGPANGQTVRFYALTPAFTYYPESRPTRDILDLSAGVGLYWFDSTAFPVFNGYLYDVRADLHVPTVVRRLSKWTVFIPTVRLGLLTFPSGFEANAFADTAAGFRSKPMEDWEKATYFGFFFDLDALVK